MNRLIRIASVAAIVLGSAVTPVLARDGDLMDDDSYQKSTTVEDNKTTITITDPTGKLAEVRTKIVNENETISTRTWYRDNGTVGGSVVETASGNQILTEEYNEKGVLTGKSSQLTEGNTVTFISYDPDDNIRNKNIHVEDGNKTTNYNYKGTEFTGSNITIKKKYSTVTTYYDKSGNVISSTKVINDADGNYVNTVFYDAQGKMLYSLDPAKPVEEPADTEPADGIVLNADGSFSYYKDGEIDKNYVGFADYDGGKFYVANGTIDTSRDGLTQDPAGTDKWYWTSAGQVHNEKSGIVTYDGGTFYIEKGVLDTTFKGLADYDEETFYVGAGRVITEYTGLSNDPNSTDDWYYIARGQVQKNYTGSIAYDGAVFKVVNGKVVQ